MYDDDIRALLNDLESAKDKLEEILAPHLSIQDEDPQYGDPVMWWASPALRHVNEAIKAIKD